MDYGKAVTQYQRARQEALKQLADNVGNDVQAAFSTPAGAKVLAALDARFVQGDLLGATPEETAFNLGAREVVIWLKRMVKVAEVVERTGRST